MNDSKIILDYNNERNLSPNYSCQKLISEPSEFPFGCTYIMQKSLYDRITFYLHESRNKSFSFNNRECITIVQFHC